MIIKEISTDDAKYINEIVEMEKLTFGKFGGVNLWILKPLVKFGKVFVALDQKNQIVGAAEFIISFDKPCAFLYGLSVHPLYQKNGIANSLLNFSEKFFLRKKITNISLTVDPKNSNAIALYKKNNYTITSFKKNEYGKNINRFFMEKNLF